MTADKKDVNYDLKTVAGFGDEWTRFTQDQLDPVARQNIFFDYFSIFPWGKMSIKSRGMDLGCGSGRWALLAAPMVGHLFVVDASLDALSVAKKNLRKLSNIEFVHASVDALPIPDSSLDFAYSLGVLHHVPNTLGAIKTVASKLKPGAPFLIYLYYAFDNRGLAYKTLWKISDCIRGVVSRLPHGLRYWVSQIIAALVYWPLARSGMMLEKFNSIPSGWPLAYYRDKPFYVMRTDALDRFGTRLEQRFTRQEISLMLSEAGFTDIVFSDAAPYWCAVGTKV